MVLNTHPRIWLNGAVVQFPKWFLFQVPCSHLSGPSKNQKPKTKKSGSDTKSRGNDHPPCYHNFRSCHPYLTLSTRYSFHSFNFSLSRLSFFCPVCRLRALWVSSFLPAQRAHFDYTSPSLADPIGDSVANDRSLVSFLTESDPPYLDTPWRTRKFFSLSLSSPFLLFSYSHSRSLSAPRAATFPPPALR